MIRSARALPLVAFLALASSGQQAYCQATSGAEKPAASSKASAYYNFALAHIYSELAGAYGNRGDYVNKAIEHYKLALKDDPDASYVFEELTDLYIQSGKLRDAVSEAQDAIQRNPDNLEARRILGRIYTRMIGESQQGQVNETMLRQAVEQYQKITEKDPKDLDSWLTLGRLYRVENDSLKAEKAFKQALALDADNDEALTGLAIVYSDVGDTPKAIEMLRKATQKNPNARTLAALASSYEQTRDYRNAADTLKRALELSPDNDRLKRALAQDLLLSDRYDEALKLYNQIAAEDPHDAMLQLRISEIYRQKHDLAKARAAMDKAKQLDPDNLEVRYDEVNLLETEGKTDQAVTALKSILEATTKKSYTDAEKANRAMLMERLGLLYRSASQYTQAIDTFRQVPVTDPDSGARVSAEIIDTYRAAGDPTKAEQEAQAAVQKYPKSRMVKLVQASVLSDMGKTDDAVALLKGMLGDTRRDRETQLSLAQVYEKAKRWADMGKALDEAEKLCKTDSERETVYFMRGALYERTKKYDAAEAEFRKVLALDPNNASALNYLGYMLADRNVRLDEAEKLISKAVQLDPQNGAYLDSLGWVYYRQNRLTDAENLLVQAIEKMAKDPTVHDHLGDVYYKQGKMKEAITQWQASLQNSKQPDSDVDPAEVAKITKKLEGARIRMAKESSAADKR